VFPKTGYDINDRNALCRAADIAHTTPLMTGVAPARLLKILTCISNTNKADFCVVALPLSNYI
jgi:hypothetical protein